MSTVIGEFRIGEDIGVALQVAAGNPAQVAQIVAAMKPARIVANRPVLDDAAESIPLNVAAEDAGWTLTLPSTATAGLEPGIYGIDARLEVAGGVEITERSAFISLSLGALS